ncbi:MAG: alanine--tRNA ligase [Nanoarchaeota archaeon]|nr:alanine--tRNA ligase [Nanoarchaeota archaeon]
MSRKELIDRYLKFFGSKGHRIIPNASLVPVNDPTVLFTTAGMHPLVPYLLSQPHPLGKRLCNVQRCIRTQDIDEVGDTYHHTFFEMLGNWSLGDYFKEQAIKMTFEFQNKVLKIPLNKYAVSVFGGDSRVPQLQKDDESANIWKSIGIPKERIAYLKGGVYESDNNWWGPAGKTGPCGPDTEQFFWCGKEKAPAKFNPGDKKWIEIGNDVLMQYVKDEKGNFNIAKQKNIDFGGGVERTVAALNGLDDNYLSDCFLPIIKEIEKISGKIYPKNDKERTIVALKEDYDKYEKEVIKAMRIIADHIKAAVFIIADGVSPSNTERGYVLRRLIRRAVKYGRVNLKLEQKSGFFTDKIAEIVFEIYDDYEILKDKKRILNILLEEENTFNKTLDRGLITLHKISRGKKIISGRDAFLLYQSYGFPIEMTEEILKEKGIKVDEKEFGEEYEKHKTLSKAAAEGKFKSGLADSSSTTTRLHTATHMLNAALKEILRDKNIHQKGSNITAERLRFDFNFPRKLSDEELKETENLINKKIKENLKVERQEMSLTDAMSSGAEAEFGAKYPERVSVYTVLDPKEKRGFFSREICTGPHVKNTGEVGKFKIIKEESSSAGVRRIKAVVE